MTIPFYRLEQDHLYAVAKAVSHEFGLDYYDPRTGIKYPAPKPSASRPRRRAKKRKKPRQ